MWQGETNRLWEDAGEKPEPQNGHDDKVDDVQCVTKVTHRGRVSIVLKIVKTDKCESAFETSTYFLFFLLLM